MLLGLFTDAGSTESEVSLADLAGVAAGRYDGGWESTCLRKSVYDYSDEAVDDRQCSCYNRYKEHTVANFMYDPCNNMHKLRT